MDPQADERERRARERGLDLLRTDRLDLVPYTAAFVHAVLAGDLERAERELGARLGRWPETPELERAFPLYRQVLLGDPTLANWHGRAIVLRDRNVAIGSVNLKGPPDGTGSVEIGYGVAPDERRRGIAREAAAAIVAYAFEDPRVRRVTAAIVPANVASVRVAEGIGMRTSHERVAKYGGDEHLWVVTREEWEARSRR